MVASRTTRVAAALFLLALIGAVVAWLGTMRPRLELGVGYAARVACGCRYIANRPLESCYKDFEPGMELIRLSDNPEQQSVTAYVPLIDSRTARLDPVLGCQPEPLRR